VWEVEARLMKADRSSRYSRKKNKSVKARIGSGGKAWEECEGPAEI
jgi:hypothetical protein